MGSQRLSDLVNGTAFASKYHFRQAVFSSALEEDLPLTEAPSDPEHPDLLQIVCRAVATVDLTPCPYHLTFDIENGIITSHPSEHNHKAWEWRQIYLPEDVEKQVKTLYRRVKQASDKVKEWEEEERERNKGQDDDEAWEGEDQLEEIGEEQAANVGNGTLTTYDVPTKRECEEAIQARLRKGSVPIPKDHQLFQSSRELVIELHAAATCWGFSFEIPNRLTAVNIITLKCTHGRNSGQTCPYAVRGCRAHRTGWITKASYDKHNHNLQNSGTPTTLISHASTSRDKLSVAEVPAFTTVHDNVNRLRKLGPARMPTTEERFESSRKLCIRLHAAALELGFKFYPESRLSNSFRMTCDWRKFRDDACKFGVSCHEEVNDIWKVNESEGSHNHALAPQSSHSTSPGPKLPTPSPDNVFAESTASMSKRPATSEPPGEPPLSRPRQAVSPPLPATSSSDSRPPPSAADPIDFNGTPESEIHISGSKEPAPPPLNKSSIEYLRNTDDYKAFYPKLSAFLYALSPTLRDYTPLLYQKGVRTTDALEALIHTPKLLDEVFEDESELPSLQLKLLKNGLEAAREVCTRD